ncbi:MAG: histidine-type phosphatase [Alistipes sp.]|nr:histidine-type phosphatase [Alistipes sp.]
MKRAYLTVVLLLSAAMTTLPTFRAAAQNAKQEIEADINKAGGVYLAYPAPEETLTPAPKGYKPFYLTHYGRHGSRYLLLNDEYDDPVEILDKAYYAGKLTPLGKDVRTRMQRIYSVAKNRAGELTQLGARQHREIAARMADNFPEIFKRRGTKITVWSSVVPRCLLSMAAACDALKEHNPSLEITRDASAAHMYKLHCFRKDFNPLLSEKAQGIIRNTDPEWAALRNEFMRRNIDPARITGLLFTKPDYAEGRFDAYDFTRKLMLNAVSLQGLDIDDVTLGDLFTTEELYGLWRYMNFDEYHRFGPSARYGNTILGEAKNMLRVFIEETDHALAAGQPSASLRFGHDTSLMAMTALMQIYGCAERVADDDKIEESWVNYRITPMAANLQAVFYRSAASDDILVKIILNEHEVRIPVASATAPYYRWKDVKQFWTEVLQNTK